jgi:hypothetical protein
MGFFSKSSDFNKNHFPALPNTLGHHVSMGEPVGGKKIKKLTCAMVVGPML